MSSTVFQTALSGNEAIRVAQGAGGPEQWMSLAQLLASTAIYLASGTGAATTVMTTSQSNVVWTGAAPTTWAVTLPPQPFDGKVVTIGTETTLTTLVTVTAASGDTLNATYNSQTLTAVTSIAFQYDAASATWYRLR